MLDRFLVEHCSPTLASIKTANLFNYFFENTDDLYMYVSDIERLLNHKGIHLEILNIRPNSALIYVYRKSKLEESPNRPEIQEFLSGYGYTGFSTAECIKRLKESITQNGNFPHEIGIFLGYPLGDVTGFIENKGCNSKYTGYWKVYCNESETLKLFEQYSKCKRVYSQLFSQGRSLYQLTVSA